MSVTENQSAPMYDRRGSDRPIDDVDGADRRRVTAKELSLFGGIALTVLGCLGFLVLTPGARILAEAQARVQGDSVLRLSVDSLRRSRDELSDRVTFMTYMQCVSTNASKLSERDQEKCTAIIKARLSP